MAVTDVSSPSSDTPFLKTDVTSQSVPVQFSANAGKPDSSLDWRNQAICSDDANTSLFFPVGVTGNAALQIERAKAVCVECPARITCLEYAITTNQEYGIWGGTSEEERRALRRVWRAEQRAIRARAAAERKAARDAQREAERETEQKAS